MFHFTPERKTQPQCFFVVVVAAAVVVVLLLPPFFVFAVFIAAENWYRQLLNEYAVDWLRTISI